MKALTYDGLPTAIDMGPFELTVIPDPTLRPDQFRVQATQQVQFPEDWLVMVLAGVRGTVHRRIEDRGATYVIQDQDAWCEDLMEAMGDVLAAENDATALNRALAELGAVAAEWTIALHRDRIRAEEASIR